MPGQRGLFFLDGEDWAAARRVLNPLLLSKAAVTSLLPEVNTDPQCRWSFHLLCGQVEAGVDALLDGWSSGPLLGLESRLYTWTTGSMLSLLLGPGACSAQPAQLASIAHHVQGGGPNLGLCRHKPTKNSSTESHSHKNLYPYEYKQCF